MSHAVALLLLSTLLIASPLAHGSGFPVLHRFWVGSNTTIASAGGDLNGDGKNDLVIVHYCNLNTTCTHGSLSVLLGKGNGSFESVTTSALLSLPFHLILADLNGDGHLDVIVGGRYLGNDVIEIRLGNGDGTFTASNVFPTAINSFLTLKAADFNGDGKLDLLGISGDSELVTLLGKGDGTFGPPHFTALPASARIFEDHLAVGDFDNDGKLDVALTVFAGSFFDSLSVNLGNGDGTFRPLTLFKPGGGLNNLVAVDFDGDGTLDLVIQGETVLRLFHGNRDGTFQISRQFNPAGVPGAFLVTADFDRNGKPDIILGDSSRLTILLNTGSTSPPTTLYYSLGIGVGAFGQGAGSLVLEDLNRDGLLDAVAIGGTATVALGSGGGKLAAPRQFRTSPFITGIAVGDFNNDDKLDVATNNLYGSIFTIMGFGNGSLGGYRKAGSIDSFGPCCLTLADFNNDGKLDALLLGTFSASGIFLGNGDRTFQPPIDLPAGSASVVGDFNGDGKLDVAVTLGGRGVQLLFGNGDGTFRAGPVFGESFNIGRIATADFNRDGNLDLLVGFLVTPDGSRPAVLLGNGDGTFQTPPNFPVGEIDGPVIANDVNGDGFPDILTLDRSGLSVFLGNGDGTFQPALNTPFKTIFTALPIGVPIHALAVADFNRDGKPDVAAIMDISSRPDITTSIACVLYGHGDGTFRAPVPLRAGGLAIDLAVGDMDRNGTSDLVVTGGSNLFTVLLNQP
jgi:large repetitive protein